jgi:hypothetical protein
MSSYTTHTILTVQHHFTQVAYPLINLVTRLPQTLSGQCPISFRCRTFETFSLSFERDPDATDVFESVKELTVASKHTSYQLLSLLHTIDSVTQLYAFYYTPSPPLSASDGWTLYSPREEFGRMGVGTRSKAWRFTDINKDYTVRSRTHMRPMIFICNASVYLSSSSPQRILPV